MRGSALEVDEHARYGLAVFDRGAELYFVCTGCHSVYATETLRPSDLADSVAAARAGKGRGHP